MDEATLLADGRVSIETVPSLAQVDLRIDPALAGRLPFELPLAPNTWLDVSGDREVLWLGPDQWLVVASEGSAATVVEDLRASLGGLHHSVVDVGANRAVVELGGPARLELLERGCGLDLNPLVWHAGVCAQTLLARVPVILQERQLSTRVFVRPSFAGSLVEWLTGPQDQNAS